MEKQGGNTLRIATKYLVAPVDTQKSQIEQWLDKEVEPFNMVEVPIWGSGLSGIDLQPAEPTHINNTIDISTIHFL